MKSPQPKPVRLLQDKHQENLQSMLGNLLRDESLSDITIHCKDGSVKAHRVILAAFSPYFRKVFQEHPEHHVAFMIHGVGVKQMRGLLELIYRGSTEVSPDMTNKFCDVADEFGVKDIIDENDSLILANTSGRDTRFRGQKRVAVDFDNEALAKLPKNVTAETTCISSEKTLLKKAPIVPAVVTTPWVPNPPQNSPETSNTSKENSATAEAPTTPTVMPPPSYVPMSAEAKRRTKWALKQRKYKCSLCPASFKRASHLSRHQLVHTGERPYACDHCDKAFSRHDKLKHHIRKTHLSNYIGNYIENAPESDIYTIGHVEMDTSYNDENFEEPARITREDLLAKMASKALEGQHHVPKLADFRKVVATTSELPADQTANDTESGQPVAPKTTSQSRERVAGSGHSPSSGQKKGRGRPRKYPPAPRPLIKRPRGRPRINRTALITSSRPSAATVSTPVVETSEASREEDYDITNMPFGDLEYLTKNIPIDQTSENFDATNRTVDGSVMEPLVEIELDQNTPKKPAEEKTVEKETTVLHHNSAGAFLQNIGLLENSTLAKMEIGECTISVSSGPAFC